MPLRPPLRSPTPTPPRRARRRAARTAALAGAIGLAALAAPVRADAAAPAAAEAPATSPADQDASREADEVPAEPAEDDAEAPADAAGDDAEAPAGDAEAPAAAEAEAEGPAEEPEPAGAAAAAAPPSSPRRPPRVDGIYLAAVPYFPVTFARVRVLDTPGAFVGAGGSARIGETVFPWLTLGVDVGGSIAYHGDQRVAQGALFVDGGFLPAPKIPFSIHVGFGVGGGAVRQKGVADRQGFGGAAFRGSLRYDVFPLVERFARKRGGGFALGPEVGWIGFTPAAKGRPMSNTIFVGLFVGYYFGS